MVSKYRPAMPIIGCSPDKTVLRQLNMSWGVIPLYVEEKKLTDELFEAAVSAAREKGLFNIGDIVVITAGIPLGVTGTTNMLKVHMVGDVLVKGVGINKLCTCGNLCVALSEDEAHRNFRDGDILVIHKTSNNILDIMKRSAGIITEEEGSDSHAAIVGMALDKPVLVGASGATQLLRSGVSIKLDTSNGIVCNMDHENTKKGC